MRRFDARTQRTTGRLGLTLVEVLVAVVILTTVVFGAVAFMASGRQRVAWATQHRVATQIGMEQLERARALGYNGVTWDYGYVSLDGTDYSWNLTVATAQADPADSGSTYKQLEVLVYWFGDETYSVTLNSAISP